MSDLPSLSKKQELFLLLAEKKRRMAMKVATPPLNPNPYIPHAPTDPQNKFLFLLCTEALYGGAAGGGKSDALLMAALQYVHVPNYSAIIFRKTYQDLSLPEALIPRSHEWLSATDAKWDGINHQWKFPSGATLAFGYMDSENSHYRYQGAAFQFIGWDELTQFPESKYKFMYSRLRSTQSIPVPLRVRAASNPGGVGHLWVKRRFIDPQTKTPDAAFIPARVRDNPHLKTDEYIKSLSYLDPITRARYLDGDWTVSDGGTIFKREWFEIVDVLPQHLLLTCAWDLAATEPLEGKDPDYTAGCVIGKDAAGIYYVLNVIRDRITPLGVESLVKQTAELYGETCEYWMEQEPGSSGVNTIDRYTREIMAGYYFMGEKTTGSKASRAKPFSSMAQAGNVKLLKGHWNSDFLDEIEIFPEGEHDDQVDAASLAFSKLAPRQWETVYDRMAKDWKTRVSKEGDEDALPKNPYDEFRVANPYA